MYWISHTWSLAWPPRFSNSFFFWPIYCLWAIYSFSISLFINLTSSTAQLPKFSFHICSCVKKKESSRHPKEKHNFCNRKTTGNGGKKVIWIFLSFSTRFSLKFGEINFGRLRWTIPSSIIFFPSCFFFWKSLNSWRPFLMIAHYHQTKTPISFGCRQKLNLRSLI